MAIQAEILKLEQGSKLWLAVRQLCITGTTVTRVLNPANWDSIDFEKENPSTYKSAAMQRGNDLEPIARAALTRRTGLGYKPVVFLNKELRMLASLDGMAMGRVATCEIKCPEDGKKSDTWIKAEHGIIPREYDHQIQFGLLLSGASMCHYWVYDEVSDDGILLTVYPDKNKHIEMLQMVRAYWQDKGRRDNKIIADLSDDNQAAALVDKLAELKANASKLKKTIEETENQLKEFFVDGSDKTVIGKLEMSLKPVSGSIDYEQAVKDMLPQTSIQRYYREPIEQFRLSLKLRTK